MGDDHEGLAGGVHLVQQVHDLAGGVAVQGAGGLVGPHQCGLGDEGTRDGDALLLATGELSGPVVCPVGEADAGEHLPRPLAGGLGRHAGDQQRQLDVLRGRQDRDQVERLEDEAHALRAVAGRVRRPTSRRGRHRPR